MEENTKLIVSSSPHIHTSVSTPRIMLDVVIALLPTTLAGIVLFGWRALAVLFTCVTSAVLSEAVFNWILHKKQTIVDFSAVVTGLLLGLNTHAEAPIWQCVIGSAFAIIVVKMLFGGLGCNFANPAITGRIFMLISFTEVGGGVWSKYADPDLVSGATPLEVMKTGGSGLPSIADLFLGRMSGAIGEVCTLALLIGFVYLVVRRVIHWETPAIFIATVFLFALCYGGSADFALRQILSGGLFLGAIFMATDYATTPITRSGRMIFAFGCGLITSLIRFYGAYPEGVSFAILLMNILSPIIEKWTAKKPLGGVKA